MRPRRDAILYAVEPAVFLDRDNTLIANDGDLGDPEAVRLIDGVADGLSALRDAGFRLVVITNQGGVARGRYDESQVDAVHQEIASLIDEHAGRSGLIDRFYYCPYHPEGTVEAYRRDHPWRKPRPGMILQAASDMRLDLGNSWVIGDQVRDVQAGRSAGCRAALITSNEHDVREANPSVTAANFSEAVQMILRERQHQPTHNGAPRVESGSDLRPELTQLKNVMLDFSEEFRMERARRSAFTPMKLAAGIVQLIALLLVLLGLMQLGQTDVFFKWMAGALLAQLAAVTILLAESQ